jgi:hypothetical protein
LPLSVLPKSAAIAVIADTRSASPVVAIVRFTLASQGLFRSFLDGNVLCRTGVPARGREGVPRNNRRRGLFAGP